MQVRWGSVDNGGEEGAEGRNSGGGSSSAEQRWFTAKVTARGGGSKFTFELSNGSEKLPMWPSNLDVMDYGIKWRRAGWHAVASDRIVGPLAVGDKIFVEIESQTERGKQWVESEVRSLHDGGVTGNVAGVGGGFRACIDHDESFVDDFHYKDEGVRPPPHPNSHL